MKLNRQSFLEAVKFLKPAIGENKSRRNLMVLNVENHMNGWVRFTSADSFMIKRVDMQTVKGAEFSKFNINKPALCTFEKICSIDKNVELVDLSASILQCGDYGLKYRQQETEFPNLERLLSTEYGENPLDNYVGLNAMMIEEAMRGFSKDQKDVVKFWFKSKEAPFKITSQDGNYTAMIMPVRITW